MAEYIERETAKAKIREKFKFVPARIEINEVLNSIPAADAIEFLQTYKVCFESMVQIGGWWLVGQDKALHRMNVPMNWPPKGTKTVEVFPLPKTPEEGE